MEIEEKEEKRSLAEYVILLDIFKLQTKKEIIISELAIKIKKDVTNSIFQNVCKKLIEAKIFKYINKIGVSIIYIINYNKLEDFIKLCVSDGEYIGKHIHSFSPNEYIRIKQEIVESRLKFLINILHLSKI